ncbi:acyltransferase [Pseudomonas sp. N040]|uniref:acyltransferase n=1 Tax=Pseudomonas sp. N040 TaxID=2785325 RepID=UPI0018A31DDA|nr:acyltransferase [Pseudomonas sp. N040]MBF7730401.1 acyltransferase [Pseudomonas sp. N040]MBW7014043.1 acyltransferase [Pseudomonas sp. N040]
MLRFLPAPLRGVIATLILASNTLILCWPLFIGALFKAALPFAAARKVINHVMHRVAETWIAINKGWMDLVQPIQWDVQGLESVDLRHSYLITSNHQSWVDILVLQYQLNRKAPFLKFFLKQELIWVPVIGLCWWALEFPFMQRFSKQYLEKHPEKRGQDMLTTRKACERFKTNPVSVFNFLEGTRFTTAKHDQQDSPFRYLLKPKAGGIAFVLDAMGEQLSALINVTIHYPAGKPTFWDLLSGQVQKIVVRFEKLEIPAQFIGQSYDQSDEYRLEFQQWVNQLWEQKDALLDRLHRDYPA